MYRLAIQFKDNATKCVIRLNDNACIIMHSDNTDYANFKKEILADEAQLQDADGLTLSAAEAKTYVSSLP